MFGFYNPKYDFTKTILFSYVVYVVLDMNASNKSHTDAKLEIAHKIVDVAVSMKPNNATIPISR
jgi:hypothetical protein